MRNNVRFYIKLKAKGGLPRNNTIYKIRNPCFISFENIKERGDKRKKILLIINIISFIMDIIKFIIDIYILIKK